MKQIYAFITAFILSAISGSAQTTVILSTDNDAMIIQRSDIVSYADSNYGNRKSFDAMAWTWNGGPGLVRSLMNFNLSAIPPNAIITEATLSLYNDPTSAENHGEHASLSGSNEAVLQRITNGWGEQTVTWNNQPLSTTEHEVTLHESADAHENYENINVKDIVVDMIHNPASSYGFLIKIKTEAYYRCMIFASSDNDNPNLHPQLKISYTVPFSVSLKPKKDAMIILRTDIVSYADSNYGKRPSYVAMAWTWNGGPGGVRSLMDFDWSVIPRNAVITKARLSLFNDPTSAENKGEHASLSGSNEAVLQRIMSPWDEFNVTWNNQPPVVTLNEVTLHQSVSAHENYPDIDVRNIVTDILHQPDSGFGLMIKIKTEQYYRSMVFASRDNANPNLHPVLNIEYTVPIIKDTIWGCLDPNATNYNPIANVSNGYCLYKDNPNIFTGCTDPFAVNFNPYANQDDNSCYNAPVVIDPADLNKDIKDTVSVRPVLRCDFDFTMIIDSASFDKPQFIANNDSVSVTWSIYQGNKVTHQTVNYLVIKTGNILFILTMTCELANKTSAAPTAVTLAKVSYVGQVTGMKDISGSDNISLFPNPANNEITIGGNLKNVEKLAIFSITGQEVFSSRNIERNINISSCPAGVYLVKVFGSNTIKTLKFVKQ